MAIKPTELMWIAGLLEGEGHFSYPEGTSPLIMIGMTDLDIIEKYRSLTRTTNRKISVKARENLKTVYRTGIYGNLAIQWMMTLYCLMGIRRKEAILKVITKWKNNEVVAQEIRDKHKKYDTTEAKRRRAVIKGLMLARQITKKEAIKLAEEMGIFPTVQ